MRARSTIRLGALAFALALPLAACAGGGNGAAQSTADAVTKAAYANDYSGVTSSFNDALKKQVTRASVGMISDKMHALGNYQGLTLLATDNTKNEYTFKAAFSKGSMNVVERLDPNGKIAAYRVIPEST